MEFVELELDSNAADITATSGVSRLNNPQFSIGKELENVKGFKVTEAAIPFSWYTITDDPNPNATYPTFDIIAPGPPVLFNRFRMSDTYPPSLANWTSWEIPPGNYTATELATEISTLVSDALYQGDLGAIVGKPTVPPHTMVYNATTRKFVLTINTSVTPDTDSFFDVFGLASDTQRNQLQGILGLSSLDKVTYTAVGNSAVYTFPDVANVTGPNYVYVNSNKLGVIAKAYLPEATAGTAGSANPEIAMIPVDVNPGSLLTWQDPSPTEHFNFENLFRLDTFDLYITAGTNRTRLDLNGQGFMIKITLIIGGRFQSQSVAGITENDRVVKRIRPA